MAYLKKLISDNGGVAKAAFANKFKVLEVTPDLLDNEDKETFQLSGEKVVLVFIALEDTKTKSGKEWPKGHYIVVEK